MKAQYKPPKIKDGNYEYSSYPYIEVKPQMSIIECVIVVTEKKWIYMNYVLA